MTAPLRYEVLDRYTMAHKGWLTDDGTPSGGAVVVGEPNFGFEINVGPREVQVDLTVNPLDQPLRSQLTEFDLVKIHHPDGRVLGIWKYELSSAGLSGEREQFILHLTPLGSELTEVDYNANHSDAADPDNQPILGLATWRVPILDAVPRTKHCTLSTIQDDGVNYAMAYPRYGKVVDTLNKGIDEGGPDWWWFVDGGGVVELRHGARTTHTLTHTAHVIVETGKTWDATILINVQPVQGGNHAGTQTVGGINYPAQLPLLNTLEVDPSSPYAVAKIGRKVATVWHDPGVLSQAGVDQLGRELLARRGVPMTTYNLRLQPSAPRVVPGDQVDYTDRVGNLVTGLWVKTVEEEGSTSVQTIQLTTLIDIRERPFRATAKSSSSGTASGLGVVYPALGGGGGGGACGGMALFFQLGGEATPALVGGMASMEITSQAFTVDVAGAAVIAEIDASVRASAAGAAGSYVELVVAIGGTSSQAARIRLSGEWENASRRVSTGVLAAGSYTLSAFLRSPSSGGTLDVLYDVNAYVV